MGRPAKYPAEFRREAIELVRWSGRPVAEVSRSLGIAEGTLWNWVTADREARERDGAPDALSESEREELKRLASSPRSRRWTSRSCGGRPRISLGRRAGDRLPVRPRPPSRLPD